jgi:hypothetical protein
MLPSVLPGKSRIFAAILAAACMFSLSCTHETRGPRITVEKFLGGVQQRHHRAIAQLWAPYVRSVVGKSEAEKAVAMAAFKTVIEDANAAFAGAKKDGVIPDGPISIAMFRALGMGKGAFSVPAGARVLKGSEGRVAQVRTRINTNLGNLNLDHLPTGVRIYLMSYPIGKLQMISVGYDEISDQNLLGSVDIDWKVIKASPELPSPTGWLVESFEVDLDSSVRWIPPGQRER